ncbi:MAG: response regulator [Clostridia bacterium]|nr:response regulator [Clostridia bacterium]
MLKIVIIDDNYEYIESLFNIIASNKLKKFEILGIFSDGKKALDYILTENIDVILLDLNMPNFNGIEMIEKLQNSDIKSKIITMTADSSFMIKLIQKNLIVYRSFIKPFDIKHLIYILNELETSSSSTIRDSIINLLNNFHFNKNTIGYLYIIDCLELCIKNNYHAMPKSKAIYEKIANIHNNNYLKIGWNIDKSIKAMNRFTTDEIKNKFFQNDKMPSTKSFINCMLNNLYSKI